MKAATPGSAPSRPSRCVLWTLLRMTDIGCDVIKPRHPEVPRGARPRRTHGHLCSPSTRHGFECPVEPFVTATAQLGEVELRHLQQVLGLRMAVMGGEF